MPVQFTVRDETIFGLRPAIEFVVVAPAERLTLRELIRARVLQEVQATNDPAPAGGRSGRSARPLIEPGQAERLLNGERAPRRWIDPQKQFERAIQAFESNGFLVLVDGQQVDDLEAMIDLAADTRVSFLRLVPLVGG